MIFSHLANLFVDIYPHGADPIRLDARQTPSPLINFQYQHALAGSYSATATLMIRSTPLLRRLLQNQRFEDIVREDAWIIVRAGDMGRMFDLTLLMVDKVYSTNSVVGGGAPQTDYMLQCRSFAKPIDETGIWFCPWGTHANVAGSAFLDDNFRLNGSPSVMVQAILQKFLGSSAGPYGAWQSPPSLASDLYVFSMSPENPAESPGIYDLIDSSSFVGQTRGECPFVNMVATEYSLPSLLNEYSNPPLNELFFDLRINRSGKLVPAMTLRERPWPVYGEDPITSAWAQLPTVHLRPESVQNDRLTLGTRYNTILISMEGQPASVLESWLLYPPLQVEPDIRLHGLRKFEVGTRFVSFLASAEAKNEPYRWNYLFHSWYGIGKDLLEGPITVIGIDPDIKVGRKLVIASGTSPTDPTRLVGYITDVGLQWSPPPGGWMTTVGLSRAYRGSDTVPYSLMREYFKDVSEIGGGRFNGVSSFDFPGMRITRSLAPPSDLLTSAAPSATLWGRSVG